MAIPTFYYPELKSSDTEAELSAEESAHAMRSRRLKPGDPLALIDGRGLSAEAQISAMGKNSVVVDIIGSTQHKPALPEVSMAVAVPKGDRQRTMVDMLTQLGVNQIIPLQCDYSVTRFTDKLQTKWQRWAIEACKQSHNAWLPVVGNSVRFNDFLRQIKACKTTAFYADQTGDSLNRVAQTDRQVTILVGPEGGFSNAETTALTASEIIPVRLAGNILRSETAAVAAATIMRY